MLAHHFMKTGILIERDGILNLVQISGQSQVTPHTLEEIQINPDAIPMVEKLKAAGFVLVATTNQPGLSSGDLSRRELDRIHDLIRRTLPIDDILVCPHDEDDMCPCHKPRPGLLREAAFKWQLNLEQSFVVSDKWQDAEAAHASGCTSLLLASPWTGSGHRDLIMGSLFEITDRILKLSKSQKNIAA
jgi:D-glycero-D-manno-heptose 1,7-bisphosphate phosphatase